MSVTIQLVDALDGLSLPNAFDKYCRHNNSGDLASSRQKPQWFKVTNVDPVQRYRFKVGDKILITEGYVTNATQGWTNDALIGRRDPTIMLKKWPTGWLTWGAGVVVRKITAKTAQISVNKPFLEDEIDFTLITELHEIMHPTPCLLLEHTLK